MVDNNDGTFKIIYTPKDVDRYTIKVKYGGEPVPKSPWTVNSTPTGDASKCDIIGEWPPIPRLQGPSPPLKITSDLTGEATCDRFVPKT